MKPHLFLHSSDRKALRKLKEFPHFMLPYEYDSSIQYDIKQNEIGFLELPEIILRFVTDQIPRKGCHWCGKAVEIIQEQRGKDLTGRIIVFIECSACGSRGPSVSVIPKFIEDSMGVGMDYVTDLILTKYNSIRPWDYNLKEER